MCSSAHCGVSNETSLMSKTTQIQKAKDFLALHHNPKLLVLPNIWDPGGARMLEHLGYPAVATASAAVAYSLGHDDGQRITFDAMVDVVRRIASAVSVPVSADIESGYGDNPLDVFDNVRRIVQAGAVGINIEDSFPEGGPLRDEASQCERIRKARNAARGENVPIVINARMDVFIASDTVTKAQMKEAVSRARAYLDAGADCIYPITLGKIDALKELVSQIQAPINVYANAKAAPMRELEKAGISRLSLGPGVFRASMTAMRDVAVGLQNYDAYDRFANAMSSDDIVKFVSKEKMD